MSSGIKKIPEYKILVVGDAGVGKSSLMLRFVEDTFSTQPVTIGVDHKDKQVQIDGVDVKLLIHDTAGQERFRTITSSFYRGAHGIIVVFDVADQVTFTNVPRWLKEIEKYANENVNKLLVGNKIDSSSRAVSTSTAKEFANTYSLQYFEASAQSGDGVDELFMSIATAIKTRIYNAQMAMNKDGLIDLNKKKGCNCVVS
jgi:Ras-related protein Rab-1A